jgi:hypothetical protein
MTEVTQILANFLHGKIYAPINFGKKMFLGYILGNFFTISSGVDVMIAIFCDFRQFSAKKLMFFSKTNVMIKILHNLALP